MTDDYMPYTFTPGGSFIFDMPSTPASVWGAGDMVLWADGEALTVAGGQGLGKTTLAQQLALGRAGVPGYDTLLGLPIEPGQGRVLYLAMDRPRQAARSFRRMVPELHREHLNQKLVVWPGPPPQDMATVPAILSRLCEEAGADTVVVDSIKDAALGLTDDAVGAGYNRARQHALTEGVQVLELHHTRKTAQGSTKEHGVDSIYGSTWITSGSGSVALLTGDPGDPVVNFHHVKQPMDECGPWQITHDHLAGRSTLHEATDLVALAAMPSGLTAQAAACALFDTDKPTPQQKEKARRKLDSLTRQDLLTVLHEGDKRTNTAKVWGSE